MTQAIPTRRFSHAKARVEERHGRDVASLLRIYADLGWSQERMATELGVSRQTVNKWVRQMNEPA